LVDAPCTGSGTLRRSPDIRWREVRLEELCQLQLQILSNASQLVKAGGRLVYATCSLLAEENQQVVEAFLLANPGFAREGATFPDSDPTFTALQRQDGALAERLQQAGELQLWPHRHNTDGFYAQVLRRH
jgi:16S rRNA (cytosine967-C5)-methyltransferase